MKFHNGLSSRGSLQPLEIVGALRIYIILNPLVHHMEGMKVVAPEASLQVWLNSVCTNIPSVNAAGSIGSPSLTLSLHDKLLSPPTHTQFNPIVDTQHI